MSGRFKGLPAPESQGPSNCLRSIWTPKTWPFYSLCFPCFSPVLFSFCSASNSLHPSELREGWCAFTYWTQHKTEVDLFATTRDNLLCTIHIMSFSATYSVFMFPSRMSQSLSECLTVKQVVHVCIFEEGRYLYLSEDLFAWSLSFPSLCPNPWPISVPACFFWWLTTNQVQEKRKIMNSMTC